MRRTLGKTDNWQRNLYSINNDFVMSLFVSKRASSDIYFMTKMKRNGFLVQKCNESTSQFNATVL